jgi:hypothetical protein
LYAIGSLACERPPPVNQLDTSLLFCKKTWPHWRPGSAVRNASIGLLVGFVTVMNPTEKPLTAVVSNTRSPYLWFACTRGCVNLDVATRAGIDCTMDAGAATTSVEFGSASSDSWGTARSEVDTTASSGCSADSSSHFCVASRHADSCASVRCWSLLGVSGSKT